MAANIMISFSQGTGGGGSRTSHGMRPSMVDWGAHPRIQQRTSSISDLHTYNPPGFAQQLSNDEGSFPWRVSKFTSNSVGGRISFLY